MKVQGQPRTIIILVPNTKDAVVMAFDFDGQRIAHIANKTDWRPRRRINGLCPVNSKLLVYGENVDMEENRSDLNTVAMINF